MEDQAAKPENPTQIQEDDDIEEKANKTDEDFHCTPYEFTNNTDKEVNYNKLIEQFGTKLITKDMLKEWERISGEAPHILLRRGIWLFTKKYFFLTETCLFSCISSRRRSLSSCTQEEDLQVKPCTLDTCYLSFSLAISRECSSVHWSSSSLMTKSSSSKNPKKKKTSTTTTIWLIRMQEILLPVVSTRNELSSLAISTTWEPCILMSVGSKSC